MKEILVYAIIFWVGVSVGYVLRAWIAKRFRNYTGTILVTHDQEKTVYSLVLDEYPETIEFRKEVVFRVDAPEENLNRN
jgi:hypothetical protein